MNPAAATHCLVIHSAYHGNVVLRLKGKKWAWNDVHIRNSKMLFNSVKQKPHLSSSSFSLHLWSPLSLENNVVFLFKAGFCCPSCSLQILYEFHRHETKLKTIRPDLVYIQNTNPNVLISFIWASGKFNFKTVWKLKLLGFLHCSIVKANKDTKNSDYQIFSIEKLCRKY